jgi:ABC-type amino acid transport substrate-binding protein
MVQAARGSEGVERFRRLGTIAGFTPRSYTALLESGAIERVETRSLEALLKTVQAGRVDGAYVNIAVAWQLLAGKAEQSGALVWNAKLPYDKSHYHLSTLRHPGVIREFDRFLKERHEWVRELKKTYDIPSEE